MWRCWSYLEFQLLWQQLLFKLFVKNFIITSTTWQRRKWSRRTLNLVQYKEQTSSAPKKPFLDELMQPSKLMSLKKNYAPCKDLLPSARTLNDYKQLLTVQAEVDAANTLFTVPSNVWCTLHYNTTSQCKTDGEWLSIIFIFSDKQQYVLHSMILDVKNTLRFSVCYWRHSIDPSCQWQEWKTKDDSEGIVEEVYDHYDR